MKDKIMNKINSRNWKFHELLKLDSIAKTLAEELYHEVDIKEQLELIWDKKVRSDGATWGMLFKENVLSELKKSIVTSFQQKFESATVNFDNQNMVIEPPKVEKPASMIAPPVEQTESLEDLVKGKDVLPNLKEKDGKVNTRAGNVKVKRV
jgi:hypothetical protein|tara:strand:- start:170 stop:622 length:453 start_codon:yes stop_codon:yes gene_type:complete